jgi:zinc D-Ala-D-Ala carboxypeptidase
MMLTEHFSYYEMIRSDVAIRHGISNDPPVEYLPKFVDICTYVLEPIRANWNIPFRPNSVYRSKRVNKLVKGSKRSRHLIAEAVDIEVPSISNFVVALWCAEHLEEFDQIILECYKSGYPNSGWVHIGYKRGSNIRQLLTWDGRFYTKGLNR